MNLKKFSKLTLLDEQGKAVSIPTLWASGPVLFVYLRHFACIACRAHATEIWKDRERYQAKGLRIVFVSNGNPLFIQTFREDLGLGKAEIFTDPGRESYEACEFHRSVGKAIGPKGIINGLKLFAQGHRQGKMSKDVGDLWQLGGIVLISKKGDLLFHYASAATGDYPSKDQIFASLP